MSVAVITDSAASLPDALVAKFDLGVVPIHLIVGGDEYLDGAIALEVVFERVDEGVSTSAPTPGQWAEAISAALETADEVVVLTIASAMSATHQAAAVAAAGFGAAVRLVDTRTAAGAEGLVVLAAARAVTDGAPADVAVAVAEAVRNRVRLVATVDTLDFLVRSGRVPGIAGLAGRVLGVNPLFEFVGGDVRKLRPAFSREAALDRIVAACRADAEAGGHLHVCALHADDAPTAERLLNAVSFELEPVESFVGSFSPGMIAHTGPGLAGLAWWWDGGVTP